MQTECLHNVVTHLSRCGCRKRGNERPLGQFGEKVEDFEVAWTKILSPLRNTVRFIDCDHRNRYALGKFEKRGSGQAFRRNIQQLVLSSSGEVQCIAEFLRTHRTVDARGRNACFHKRTDLILHQRNERRNDQRQAGKQHGGHLIADGLARTGRHNAERIPAGKDGANQLILSRAERIVAEILFENVLCGHGLLLTYNSRYNCRRLSGILRSKSKYDQPCAAAEIMVRQFCVGGKLSSYRAASSGRCLTTYTPVNCSIGCSALL